MKKMTKKKTVKKTPVSFEAAIIQRAAHPQKGVAQPEHHHDTTAHDVAVEDGSPTPMSHMNDVRPPKF